METEKRTHGYIFREQKKKNALTFRHILITVNIVITIGLNTVDFGGYNNR